MNRSKFKVLLKVKEIFKSRNWTFSSVTEFNFKSGKISGNLCVKELEESVYKTSSINLKYKEVSKNILYFVSK